MAAEPENLANQIIDHKLTVRQAEELARNVANGSKSTLPHQKDADTKAFEKKLTESLGLTVTIKHKDKVGGQVVIAYKTLDQFDEIVKKLGVEPR